MNVKNKIFIITLIGMLIFSSFIISAEEISKKPLKIQSENISSYKINVVDQKQYVSILVDQATTYTNNPGRPVLPVISKTYELPFGSIVNDVLCNPSQISETYIDKQVNFAQKPVIYGKTSVCRTIKDQSIYDSSELYPSSWYNYNIRVGFDGEKHVTYLTIYCYPVRYSPKNNILKTAETIDVSFSYNQPVKSISNEENYDMVIICPNLFKFSLRKLVNHKNNHGVKTKIVTTNQIYRSYEGRDDAEKIKYFIMDSVEQDGISYVLLFGGMNGQKLNRWHVPIRYSHLDDASSEDGFPETSFLSDLYFSDIYKYDETLGYSFEDWDSNGNGVFAEWNTENKDVLDLDPDVYVGRIPVRSFFEVGRIANRIIKYETETYNSDWFNHMVVIGGDSFDDSDINGTTDFIEGQVVTNHAISFMQGFSSTRIWADDGDLDLTSENILSEISKGSGFLFFEGHGNPTSWSTHPAGEFGTWIGLDNSDMKQLKNKDKLPVCIVGGCHNCQFDTSVGTILEGIIEEGFMNYFTSKFFYGEWAPKCWGGKITTIRNGGSIATIGCSGLGYGTVGDGPIPTDEIPDSVPDGIPDCIQYLGGWIETQFFKIYNETSHRNLGRVHSTCIHNYLNQFPIDWNMDWDDHENYAALVDVKTMQQWVLFGDPSLKIGGYN